MNAPTYPVYNLRAAVRWPSGRDGEAATSFEARDDAEARAVAVSEITRWIADGINVGPKQMTEGERSVSLSAPVVGDPFAGLVPEKR